MRSSNPGQTAALPISARPARRVNVEKLTPIAIFLVPAAILYTIFLLLPILQAGYYSFFKWNGLGAPTEFVGLGNFSRVLSDTVFRGALIHNILILVLSIALQLPLA